MTKHLTSRQIERYREGALDPSELIEVDEHLAGCAKCRRELNAVGQDEDRFFPIKTEAPRVINKEPGPPPPQSMDESAPATSPTISTTNQKKARPQTMDEAAPATLETPPRIRTTIQKRARPSLNSPAVMFGLGALSMLVVVLLVWLVVRSSGTRTNDRQVAQPTASSPLPGGPTASEVQPGASPLPSASPTVLMALTDGASQVGIDEKGNLVGLETFPPNYREMVKIALITQQAVNLAALSGVGGQDGGLNIGKKQGPGFGPLSPVGKIVFSNRPTLRWSKLDGASEYRVEIYGPNSDLVASSPPLKSTSWEVPNDLIRGEIFSWQVTATKDGTTVKTPVAPASEAKFKTLDTKQATDLTAARKDFTSSHLGLGVIYAQFGLLDDAEREFTALATANPQSDIARKLLSNVKAAKTAGLK